MSNQKEFMNSYFVKEGSFSCLPTGNLSPSLLGSFLLPYWELFFHPYWEPFFPPYWEPFFPPYWEPLVRIYGYFRTKQTKRIYQTISSVYRSSEINTIRITGGGFKVSLHTLHH